MFETILFILYGVLLFVFGVAAWKLRRVLGHFRMKQLLSAPGLLEDLPSVTVCIPARNETHALAECLEHVTASTYPKLEIVVLDDVSADDTPVLIKSFAHAGVRFVEGSALPDGWLGKNHALNELTKEASGTYILFMDVDTRLAPDSIGQLVAYAQQEDAAMVSVLPRRDDGLRASVLFGTLRYFWPVMFHRSSSPAVAGSAWMIRRKTLQDRWKGFTAFKSAIQPESRFAADLAAERSYRFLLGTELLGISYEKKWRSQLETSVRLLFPLLGARLSHSIIAALDLLIVATPLFIVLGGFIFGWGLQQAVAVGFILLFAGLYGVFLRQLRRRGWVLGAVLWPLIVVQEAALVIASAIQYRRRAVTWKGRTVRMPRD
jgi:glycosyltransferase involved in cell wall biosynthesis